MPDANRGGIAPFLVARVDARDLIGTLWSGGCDQFYTRPQRHREAPRGTANRSEPRSYACGGPSGRRNGRTAATSFLGVEWGRGGGGCHTPDTVSALWRALAEPFRPPPAAADWRILAAAVPPRVLAWPDALPRRPSPTLGEEGRHPTAARRGPPRHPVGPAPPPRWVGGCCRRRGVAVSSPAGCGLVRAAPAACAGVHPRLRANAGRRSRHRGGGDRARLPFFSVCRCGRRAPCAV